MRAVREMSSRRQIRGQCQVILRAQLVPVVRRVHVLADLARLFREDNGEPEVEVPVDVTVEDPGAGVVRVELDGDVVSLATRADDVTADGVFVRVGRAGAVEHRERMAVEMEWMRAARCSVGGRHAYLYRRIARERIDTALGQQLIRFVFSAEHLEKDWDGDQRDVEGDSVDGEVRSGLVRRSERFEKQEARDRKSVV